MSKATLIALAEMVKGKEIATLRKMCKDGTDVADILDSLIDTATKALAGQHLDNCQICHGLRGGVKGNENIVHGMTVCDYCHCSIMTATDAVRDQTLRVAGHIAKITAEQKRVGVAGSLIATALDSVRLKDGKWQSQEAMALWGKAAELVD
jgi:hypothetical protein